MIETKILNSALDLTETWKLQGKWDDALTFLSGLHALAKNLDTNAQARIWLQIGRTLTDEALFGGKDNQKKRQEALDQARNLAEVTKDKALLGDVYDAIGFSLHAGYLNSDRSKEPKDEMEFFERGLELRKQFGTPGQVAESSFHLGLVYDVIRQDHETALPYHTEAYKLAREAKDQLVTSYAIRHIGFSRLATDDLEGARQAFTESLELREAIGFTPGIAFSLATLAHVDILEGNKDAALSRLKKAREFLLSLGATARVAWLDEKIADVTK